MKTTYNVQLPLGDTPNNRTGLLLEELERTIMLLESEIGDLHRVLRERKRTLYAARHLYGIYKPKKRREPAGLLRVHPEEFLGLTLEDSVLLIADRNNGVVESTPANNLLREAGILPDDNRARTRLYHYLSNSPRFERVDRGVYRLAEDYRPDSGLTDDQEALLEQLRTN